MKHPFITGIALTLIALGVFGMTYAAIANAGTTVTVPTGKTMIYFTMNTNDALELRDALCYNYHYQAMLYPDEGEKPYANPESCSQFGQRMIAEFAKDHITAYRRALAEQNLSVAPAPTITT